MHEVSVVERALELAKTGAYRGLYEIAVALKKEGFSAIEVEQHLGGGGMRKQLKNLGRSARASSEDVRRNARP